MLKQIHMMINHLIFIVEIASGNILKARKDVLSHFLLLV